MSSGVVGRLAAGARVGATAAVNRVRGDRPAWVQRGTVLLRLGAFTAISIALAFPQPSAFSTHLPGDPGDVFLVYWILGWGAHVSTSLYRGYWTGPMFGGNPDTMSYTETLLPLTPVHRLLSALLGSPILSMNVIYLATWVIACEATYRLVRRYVRSGPAAPFAAAIAFTFSTIRLSQSGHYQLVFACFLPLGILTIVRLLERPTKGRVIAAGVMLPLQFLTAAYYGVLLAMAYVAFALVHLARRARRLDVRRDVVPLLLVAAIAGGLMLPVAAKYRTLQGAPGYRTDYPAGYALRLGDLRTAHPLTRNLDGIDVLTNDSATRSSENFAYVGFFAIVFAPLGALVVIRRGRTGTRTVELATLLGIGLVGFLIALGRNPVLGMHSPVYDVARRVLPGVRSMLAIVRLFVVMQLALVALAAVGLDAVLQRIGRWRVAAGAVGAAVSVLVVLESAARIPLVRVPQPVGVASVYRELRSKPQGLVAELPMAPPELGATYAYIEAPRLLLATTDWHPRLNGYSGYTPVDYPGAVRIINAFPADDAVAELERRRVRYVLVHTASIDTGFDPITEQVDASGYAFTDGRAMEVALAARAERFCGIDRYEGALLVELPVDGTCVG